MTPQQSLFEEAAISEAAASSCTEGLNPPQREAVEHFRGPILVLAGAGSGKTRVLTRRVANLVLNQNVSPRNILAVTFTNKATEEMRRRLFEMLGKRADDLWVATFHSTCLRILRRYATLLGYKNDFIVYDDDDTKGLLKQILDDLGIDQKQMPPSGFQKAIDKAKNNFVLPEQIGKGGKDLFTQYLAEVYDRYQKALLAANAMDFGDLMVNAVLVLKRYPEVLKSYQQNLHFVLIDEFQDTNFIQYLFIRLITALHKNLLVVGDDDQSIYAFRGATIRNILDFEKDFPGAKVVKLEQNYRSTGTILESANAVIAKNTGRKSKKLWTSSGKGAPIVTYLGQAESEEAEFVAQEIASHYAKGKKYQDIAIFYRTNAQSRAIEDALMRYRIPYRIYGGLRFYDRKEIKDIVGYLRLIANPADVQAFMRVLNTPPRGIGAQALLSIANKAKELSCSFSDAAKVVGETQKAVQAFVELMRALTEDAATLPLGELIDAILVKSEYREKLKKLKDPQVESRLENLQELVALGKTFNRTDIPPMEILREFLDKIALASSAELPKEAQDDPNAKPDTVSLMTLHLAKGLEYPIVFFTGLEEGLLPHYRSIEEDAIEEERRLCYVGITRAMEQLYMTRAMTRGMFSAGGGMGNSWDRQPSRFIFDIPEANCQHRGFNFFETPILPSSTRRDDDDDEPYTRFFDGEKKGGWQSGGYGTSRTSSARKPTTAFGGLPKLMTADALPPKEFLPAPPLESLSVGMKITHPTFGPGQIQEILGDSQKNALIVILFEKYEKPKKLQLSKSQITAVGTQS